MGGAISKNCNDLAKDIWKFCIKEKVWISAENNPESENSIADFMSRSFITIQNGNFLLSTSKNNTTIFSHSNTKNTIVTSTTQKMLTLASNRQ